MTSDTSYTYTIAAYDRAGNVSGSSATYSTATPDVTPPVVSIMAPLDKAVVSGSAVTLSATATDRSPLASIQFLLDGLPFGAAGSISPLTLSWNTLPLSGTHTIAVRASYVYGNSATSQPITVTISNGGAGGGGGASSGGSFSPVSIQDFITTSSSSGALLSTSTPSVAAQDTDALIATLKLRIIALQQMVILLLKQLIEAYSAGA